MPPTQEELWPRLVVAMGATPFDEPLYPNRRRNLLQNMTKGVVGEMQDRLSEMTGGALPRGTFY